MKISVLLDALINVAEKGANIARIIRSEASLLDLLVQEKKGDQKNERFVKDFKTLADVLVQEVVRYDLKKKFPGIGGSIYGEESNRFTNMRGDKVIVEIQDTPELTQSLLSQVLNDDEEASRILSHVIHQDVQVAQRHDTVDLELAVDDIGVWIDPIDSTAQYIQGDVGTVTDGLVSEGLQCVAVLIGVYEKTSGLPIIGVINQPFSHLDNSKWSGCMTWGVSVKGINANSLSDTHTKYNGPAKTVLISSSELEEVKVALGHAFNQRHISGAGYKLLGVCHNLAEAYILTKSSNYKWDCCGPHAILRSMGGGIVKYSDLYEMVKSGQNEFSQLEQIKYNVPDNPESSGAQRWCNQGGIVAYKSADILNKIGEAVKDI